jgi:hypothetical protein
MKRNATGSNKLQQNILDSGYDGPTPSEQQRKFLHEYVRTGKITLASKSAGYGKGWANGKAQECLKRFQKYVVWIEAGRAKEVSKKLAIDIETVSQYMAKIVFANPMDYVVVEPAEKDLPIRVRMKRVDELTRDQAVAICNLREADGTVIYDLMDRIGHARDLFRSVGGLNEKIILEHRHRHIHAKLDLSKVDSGELQKIEAELAKQLGVDIEGEFEEVES